jgi:hypothetical protein
MHSQSMFLAFLDELALPHRASLRDLRARYGVRPSKYYGWDIVEIADAKAISLGQVGGFYFNADEDPDLLPPIAFSGFIARDADVRANHRKVVEALSAIFGEAPQDRSVSNTIAHIWRFEAAAMAITSWPSELNRNFTNPAIARNTELADFCHLRLTNGYRPPLTREEEGWLREAAPFANLGLGVRPAIEPFDPLWNGANRGLYRWLPSALCGRQSALTRSSDGKGLVGIGQTEALVLSRDDISAVCLSHILPARGSGGSALAIEYADRFSSGRQSRTLKICAGSEIHDLDALAAEIAEWGGVEVRVSEYDDD